MASIQTLHVIAARSVGLTRALERAATAELLVRGWQALPPSGAIDSGDLILLDLDDLPTAVRPEGLASAIIRRQVCVVAGDGLVGGAWLPVVADGVVQVIACPSRERATGYHPVLAWLAACLRRPSGHEIAEAILRSEAWLTPLGELVELVCRHPWEVRRPRQLAVLAAMTPHALKVICAAQGFARVEHFITDVRMVGVERLMTEWQLHQSVAHTLIGVKDYSNFRRQLDRAKCGSRPAWRRLRTSAVVAFWLCVAAVAACGEDTPAQDREVAAEASDTGIALPVVGAMVWKGDLVLSVMTTGEVRAERLVTLKAEAAGTVLEVPVRPGARVDSGAVLVRLDPRPFDLAVREAEGALAEALGRYRDQFIGEDTTDMSAGAVERRRTVRLRSGADAAEARLERAKLDRERAVLRAPFGGTADLVPVVPGQHVGVGESVATVVDLGSLVVEASVLEHDLALIQRGASASVTLNAAPDQRYAGRVIAVLPLVDSTSRAGRALVRVRTRDQILRPGMYADVELEAARLPARVIVPAAAVIERDGRPLVFRYRGGRAEWVYVTPGRSNGRETEILPAESAAVPAIAPGDTVLVEGHLTLAHDAPVRLVGKEDAPREVP